MMNKEMSTIEVAIDLMEKKKTPQNIYKFLSEVSEIMGVDGTDADFLSQLYIDITTSARFIFVGDDNWDLKERKVSLWDKDGSFFNDKLDDDDDDDDNGLTVDDYNLDDDEEDLDEDEESDDDYYDDDDLDEDTPIEEDLHEINDDDDDTAFDEDEYTDIMDDYEKYYE